MEHAEDLQYNHRTLVSPFALPDLIYMPSTAVLGDDVSKLPSLSLNDNKFINTPSRARSTHIEICRQHVGLTDGVFMAYGINPEDIHDCGCDQATPIQALQ
jgi:hypothetical protein